MPLLLKKTIIKRRNMVAIVSNLPIHLLRMKTILMCNVLFAKKYLHIKVRTLLSQSNKKGKLFLKCFSWQQIKHPRKMLKASPHTLLMPRH